LGVTPVLTMEIVINVSCQASQKVDHAEQLAELKELLKGELVMYVAGRGINKIRRNPQNS
jgi:hypothetical protein